MLYLDLTFIKNEENQQFCRFFVNTILFDQFFVGFTGIHQFQIISVFKINTFPEPCLLIGQGIMVLRLSW